MKDYYTWDGEPLRVTYTLTGPPRKRGGPRMPEANVKRTFTPSMELWSAIFDRKTGILNDKDAPAIPLHTKTKWLHVWDGVQCRSISPMEAWDCVSAGMVHETLLVRASNYMHLL